MPSSFTERFQNDDVLKRVLDSVADYAIFALDPDGLVATWNDGARQIKGYEAEEVVGRHFRMLYLPEDQERKHPETNLRLARENGEFREERLRMRKGGESFEADVDISPIYGDDGKLAGFLKVVRDVSETKRNREELKATLEQLRASRDELEMRVLQRTAQLHHANQDLEAFCYSIAHDLRIPIRGIIAKCRIAEEDFGTHMPEEGKVHLDDLVSTAKRLSDLVDDLLEFARLGQKEVTRQRVDITAMARRLGEEIVPTCHGGSATIQVDEGMEADADPDLVEIVMRNLLENACKYSARDVNVVVGCSKVGNEEMFYVKDDGIGFDMAYVSKLFLPFERLHRDGNVGGTGIGLANVKRIVVRHGGKVWADGTPGVGATFFFTLKGAEPLTTKLDVPYEPFPKPLLACFHEN